LIFSGLAKKVVTFLDLIVKYYRYVFNRLSFYFDPLTYTEIKSTTRILLREGPEMENFGAFMTYFRWHNLYNVIK